MELHGCTRDYGAVRAVDALDLAVSVAVLVALRDRYLTALR